MVELETVGVLAAALPAHVPRSAAAKAAIAAMVTCSTLTPTPTPTRARARARTRTRTRTRWPPAGRRRRSSRSMSGRLSAARDGVSAVWPDRDERAAREEPQSPGPVS